jgi:hypothetical protein
LVVLAGESNKRQSRAVGSQLVSNNDGRREALPLQQFPEQLKRGRLVPPRLDQHIEDLAFAVDRPPHVHAAPCDRDHHLIEMPPIMRHRPSAPEVLRDRRPEFQYPSSDGLVADVKPALRQQVLDIAIAQCEAKVEPNRVPDDIWREAVAGVGDCPHPPSVVPSRPERWVNVSMPFGLDNLGTPGKGLRFV